MPTYSNVLDLLYQITNENPDLWGDILNDQQKLLETAFDTATITLTGSSYTLDDSRGSDPTSDHYRYGIINITGSPGGDASVNVPVGITSSSFLKKVWLVIDNTTGGNAITFKTATGTGVTLNYQEPTWCYCDGTNIINASNYAETAGSATTATTATSATSADDSSKLGGVVAASYAQTSTLLDTRNTWTKGQVVQRATLTESVGVVTPNVTTSNAFYCLWGGNWQLGNPGGSPVNGDVFSLVVEQDTGGGHTISFDTQFAFEGGSAPALSTLVGEVDLLMFEYCTDIGNKWIGTILSNVS